MELVSAIGIGIIAAAGVWLVLRPRTFQVILGLSLLTYAVNAFLLSMGGLTVGAPPVLESVEAPDPTAHADPVPQSLVLTSIVISFSMTALYLVVLLTSRGLTGTDHVDAEEAA
jgi:multicomponent K+:H+ antiporter subunit C